MHCKIKLSIEILCGYSGLKQNTWGKQFTVFVFFYWYISQFFAIAQIIPAACSG